MHCTSLCIASAEKVIINERETKYDCQDVEEVIVSR